MYQRITDWSRAGRYLMYKQAPGVNDQLWVVPLFGDRKPVPYTNSSVQEHGGVFSNDGRWVAYISNETGRLEIFVRPGPLDGANEFLIWRVTDCTGAARQERKGMTCYASHSPSHLPVTKITDGCVGNEAYRLGGLERI